MKKRVLTLIGAGVTAGALAIGAAGLVAAQGPGPGPGTGPGVCPATATQATCQAAGPLAGQPEEVRAAVAAVLGMTVEELEAAHAEGKTILMLAQERGIDMAAIHAAVQAARQQLGLPANGFGPRRGGMMGGMMGGPMGRGPGAGAQAGWGQCPYATP